MPEKIAFADTSDIGAILRKHRNGRIAVGMHFFNALTERVGVIDKSDFGFIF
jgi:hypothetical protein